MAIEQNIGRSGPEYAYKPAIDPKDDFLYSLKSRLLGTRIGGEEPLPELATMAEKRRSTRPPAPDGLGICLSGGGIRAAAFGLGALQSLGQHGYLWGQKKAKFLAAVSGGSYIAGAFTMLASDYAETIPVEPEDFDGEAPSPGLFTEGSPEESYLRNHLSYLTHGSGGLPAFVWSLLLGITLNLVVVALAIQASARPLGWVYGYYFPSLSKTSVNISISIPQWVVWTAVALGVCALVAGWVAVGIRMGEHTSRQIYFVSAGVVVVAILFSLFLVGIPELLVFVRGTVARIGGTTHQTLQPATSVSRSTSRLAGVAGGGAVAAVATILAGLRSKVTSPTFEKDEAKKAWQKLKPWLAKHRPMIINAVAFVIVPLLIVSIFMVFVELGAANTVIASRHGRWWPEVLVWGIPAVALTALWRFSDLNSWSMHAFYKRALCRAFCIQRDTNQHGNLVAKRRPYNELARFSRCQSPGVPELLVCATANVSDYGLTPTGTKAAGYVFSARKTGSDLVGVIATQDYEDVVGKRLEKDLTIPAAVSIAGAALSPEMGRMTRAPFRALMALANMRLGVWLPNPLRVAEFSRRNQARLRFPYAPRMHFLMREMFGINHARSKFLYVTDGGHYENLGLVELLRRRCQRIICVDASGETIDTFSTIFQAIRMAGAELNVNLLSFDPTTMGSDPDHPGLVKSVYARGTFTYGDGSPGELTIVKTGVPKDAPPVILDYRKLHPTFPYDTTADQFYDADRFDAYRILGSVSMEEALDSLEEADAKAEAERPTINLTDGQASRQAAAPAEQPV
jgi:hypothetical protein